MGVKILIIILIFVDFNLLKSEVDYNNSLVEKFMVKEPHEQMIRYLHLLRQHEVHLDYDYKTLGLLSSKLFNISGSLFDDFYYPPLHRPVIIKSLDRLRVEEKLDKKFYKKFGARSFLISLPDVTLIMHDYQNYGNYLLKMVSYFDIYANFQFIFVRPVDDTEWLYTFFDMMWNLSVINYLLVFQHHDVMNIISYNPFTKKLTNFTHLLFVENKRVGARNFFADKLTDLNGFNFNVAMMNDPPRNYYSKDDPSHFNGEDYELLKLITSGLNATFNLTVFDEYKQINQLVRNDSVHLTFARRFALYGSNELVSPLIPTLLEYIVCAVPNSAPLPQYEQIFTIFELHLWIIIWSFILAFGLILQKFLKIYLKHQEVSKTYLVTLGLFLGSVPNINFVKPSSVRIITVAWILFGYLIINTFNSQLGSTLIKVRYAKPILSIEELVKSDLKLGMISGFEPYLFMNEPLLQNMKIVKFNSIYDQGRSMVKQKDRLAYIGLKSIFDKVAVTKRADGLNRYIILEKTMIPGYNVYDMPLHSVFAKKIESLISRSLEGRFSRKGFKPVPIVRPNNDPIKITILHLLGAFMILVFGLIISGIVFAFELFSKNHSLNDVIEKHSMHKN